LMPQQQVTLVELDEMLDVDTDQFGVNVKKIAKLLAKSEATLDLESYRQQRLDAATLAGPAELPDIRDALYSADLKRLMPMDREEEFRMARRHEFMVGLLTWVMSRYGVEEEAIATLLK